MARKNPVREYLSKIGRKGGQKKVAKGFAALNPTERTELAKRAAAARWGNAKPKRRQK